MQQLKLNLWTISWPIYVEIFLGFAVFFADALFLSQISDDVAGTIGSLLPVFGVCALLLTMMAQAGTTVASQYIGGKHFEMVSPTYMTMVILNVFLGIILVVLWWSSSGILGLWMGFPDEMNIYSTDYLELIAFSWVFVGVRSAYSAILASRGLTFWNMGTAIILNATNVGLNYLFLTGSFGVPKLGIIGIAIASIISIIFATSIAVCLVHFKLEIQFQWKDYSTKFKELVSPILKIGIPSTLEPVIYNVCQVFMTLMVVQLGLIEMGTRTFTVNISIFGLTWGGCVSGRK